MKRPGAMLREWADVLDERAAQLKTDAEALRRASSQEVNAARLVGALEEILGDSLRQALAVLVAQAYETAPGVEGHEERILLSLPETERLRHAIRKSLPDGESDSYDETRAISRCVEEWLGTIFAHLGADSEFPYDEAVMIMLLALYEECRPVFFEIAAPLASNQSSAAGRLRRFARRLIKRAADDLPAMTQQQPPEQPPEQPPVYVVGVRGHFDPHKTPCWTVPVLETADGRPVKVKDDGTLSIATRGAPHSYAYTRIPNYRPEYKPGWKILILGPEDPSIEGYMAYVQPRDADAPYWSDMRVVYADYDSIDQIRERCRNQARMQVMQARADLHRHTMRFRRVLRGTEDARLADAILVGLDAAAKVDGVEFSS